MQRDSLQSCWIHINDTGDRKQRLLLINIARVILGNFFFFFKYSTWYTGSQENPAQTPCGDLSQALAVYKNIVLLQKYKLMLPVLRNIKHIKLIRIKKNIH